MPTPSAPDPQTPFTFSSTCPDTDDSSAPRHDTHMELATDSIHHSAVREDDSASPSTDTSPRSHLDTSDGPVQDSEMEASSPIADNHSYLEPQKPAELEFERTDSPYDPSPTEPIQTSRPRQGVGTSHPSAYHMDSNATPKSQYPHTEYATEQDYTLPSMGYGYPSRRVCFTRVEWNTLHRIGPLSLGKRSVLG